MEFYRIFCIYIHNLFIFKDKWAAFWPFTGILVITLTILGMLFIYEKCRTKPVVGDTGADNYQALLASEGKLKRSHNNAKHKWLKF